jgi:hypothetical protein
MAVKVTLAVQVGSNEFVSEPEMTTMDPGLVRGRDPLFGRLIIEAAGQPKLVLHDDLEYLVVNMFQAIPQLIQGQSVTVWHSDSPAEFRMEPVDSRVRITGTVLSPVEAPLADFLPELLASGERFIDFVRTVLADQPDFQARRVDLEHWAEEAAAAVQLWAAESAAGPADPRGPATRQ